MVALSGRHVRGRTPAAGFHALRNSAEVRAATVVICSAWDRINRLVGGMQATPPLKAMGLQLAALCARPHLAPTSSQLCDPAGA